MASLLFTSFQLTLFVTIILTYQDVTLDWDASGEKVVDSIIDKIESSCLFENNKFMLKRLAYTQSMFGKLRTSNETLIYDGGMWKITRGQFEYVKTRTHEQLIKSVFNKFRADLSRISYEDLNRPFYSGLIQMLHLELLSGNKFEEIPVELDAQALIFAKYIKANESEIEKNVDLYKARVFKLQTASCEVKRPFDLIILADESNGMKASNFDKIKKLLTKMVRNIDIGNSQKHSRISLITYSDEAYLAYQLNDTQNLPSIEKALSSMPIRTHKSQQKMATGLEMIAEEIEFHKRNNIPMIGLVVTDAPSDNKTATLKAARVLHKRNIGMFVLAFGNPKNHDLDELTEIASKPLCQYLYLVKAFTEVENFNEFLGKKISQAPNTIYGKTGAYNMNYILPSNEEINFQLILSAYGTQLEVKNGDCSKRIEFFYSRKLLKPNEIFHEKKYLINCKNPFKLRLHPYSMERNQLYGTIRINSEEIYRSLERRQANLMDFKYDEEDELGEFELKTSESDCKTAQHIVTVPLEIDVEGYEPCEPGFYGKECNKKCKCRGNVPCESTTGECPNCACASGYYGPACQTKCPVNTYSYMCSKKCHCSSFDQCDAVTGECPDNTCADGWTGHDCQTFACHGRKGNYFPDEDFCDKFWFCESNRNGEVGHHITCPNGLYWERNTNVCKPEGELITRCSKGTSVPQQQLLRYNLEDNPDFAQVQYDVYQLYKALNTDTDDEEDEELRTASSALKKIKVKFNYLICMKNLDALHETLEDYQCPVSQFNLTRLDNNARFQKLKLSSPEEHMQDCSEDFAGCSSNFFHHDIYRHDANSCLAYHKCEYSPGTLRLTHTTFNLCNGAIFNQYLVKCIKPIQARLFNLKSTMPNPKKKALCNQLVMY